jgi:hypothetical protein
MGSNDLYIDDSVAATKGFRHGASRVHRFRVGPRWQAWAAGFGALGTGGGGDLGRRLAVPAARNGAAIRYVDG